MSTKARWSTPGRRSAPARRSARTCTSPAAPASAACSSRCRPDPVIIEDNCFIGARSEVAEGVIVREGSVLSMGVFIGASTKIVDRDTGEIFMGEVPAYSVVVPGALPGKPMKDGTPARPLLRGDRQARGRADALEDQHQRAAAGLTLRWLGDPTIPTAANAVSRHSCSASTAGSGRSNTGSRSAIALELLSWPSLFAATAMRRRAASRLRSIFAVAR